MRVDRSGEGLAGNVGPDLTLELNQRIRASPGDRLVRIDDDALDADRVPERHEDRRELHGRTVRVGDDTLVPGEVVGVDLAHDQRNSGIHAPGRRVIDDGRASCSGLRGEFR